tara:strand:- start:9 stop:257 length:249 start_codon:yes stop_codon:yes gene_type:complete
MGFLFGGGGSSEPAPAPQPTESVKKQEQKVQRQEIEERRKINQRTRKMQTGGMSQLLGDRDDPAQGNPVQVQRTLGPDRNPR